jgi:SMODS and SLOG-associating 2TM effector domain
MRGSNEPEYSYLRQHTLTSFIRKLEAFLLDHGTERGNAHDKSVEDFRDEFERLLIPPRWSGRMIDFLFDREKKRE